MVFSSIVEEGRQRVRLCFACGGGLEGGRDGLEVVGRHFA